MPIGHRTPEGEPPRAPEEVFEIHHEKLFRNVRFRKTVQTGGKEGFRSSDPSRKIIILADGEEPLTESEIRRGIDVYLEFDTNVRENRRGAFIVKRVPPGAKIIGSPASGTRGEALPVGRARTPETPFLNNLFIAIHQKVHEMGLQLDQPLSARPIFAELDVFDRNLTQTINALNFEPTRNAASIKDVAELQFLVIRAKEALLGVEHSGATEGSAPMEGEAPIVPEAREKPYIPPAVERDEQAGFVYVLETALPLNPAEGTLVPRPEQFTHFTLDASTAEILNKIAIAVSLREPCLLEGETSTSKTSAIEYLAMMTGNEVIRLNLNGQTDTAELVGKFVPNDESLQISFNELLQNIDVLQEASRAILQKVRTAGRGLTLIESQKIAAHEGLHVKGSDWRWQDGLDVEAKKRGAWLILDEINLAEPQILERLNPQLEKHRSLTLSENKGVVLRELNTEEMKLHEQGGLPGVEPIHPNFRIFGTMNPPSYTGRAALSPAYKDRWTSFLFTPPPGVKEYTAMLNLMVFGEQPKIETKDGGTYKNPDAEEPLYETLQTIQINKEECRKWLAKLAKLHTRVAELARHTEIGKGNKEKYIFTRRGLMQCLAFLATVVFVDRKTKQRLTAKDAPEIFLARALKYYYLDKFPVDSDDVKKVKDAIEAVGFQV